MSRQQQEDHNTQDNMKIDLTLKLDAQDQEPPKYSSNSDHHVHLQDQETAAKDSPNSDHDHVQDHDAHDDDVEVKSPQVQESEHDVQTTTNSTDEAPERQDNFNNHHQEKVQSFKP